jgi:hypothetical protein
LAVTGEAVPFATPGVAAGIDGAGGATRGTALPAVGVVGCAALGVLVGTGTAVSFGTLAACGAGVAVTVCAVAALAEMGGALTGAVVWAGAAVLADWVAVGVEAPVSAVLLVSADCWLFAAFVVVLPGAELFVPALLFASVASRAGDGLTDAVGDEAGFADGSAGGGGVRLAEAPPAMAACSWSAKLSSDRRAAEGFAADESEAPLGAAGADACPGGGAAMRARESMCCIPGGCGKLSRRCRDHSTRFARSRGGAGNLRRFFGAARRHLCGHARIATATEAFAAGRAAAL